METRNILDKDDNIIGTLTLPDGTSEETWTIKLDEYKYAPPEIEEEIIPEESTEE